MNSNAAIEHEFVELIPAELAPDVLYISIPYATAAHNCACGCGQKVVTPISRRGWSLGFDGETVSLHPSIGNYGLPCQSHYFIRRDRVGRAAISPAQKWMRIVDATDCYRRSGLTMNKLAGRHGVSMHSLTGFSGGVRDG